MPTIEGYNLRYVTDQRRDKGFSDESSVGSGAFGVSLARYLWPLGFKRCSRDDIGAWVKEANFRYPTSVEAARSGGEVAVTFRLPLLKNREVLKRSFA